MGKSPGAVFHCGKPVATRADLERWKRRQETIKKYADIRNKEGR